MMRVLLVAGTHPPQACGVGDYVERLAQALARESGVSVGVLTTDEAAADASGGFELLRTARSWTLGEMPRILRAVRFWKPDLVHIHYPSQGFYGRLLPVVLPLAWRLLGATVIQTWHEPWPLRSALRVGLQRLGAHGLIFVRADYEKLLSRWLRPLLRNLPRAAISSAAVLPTSRLPAEERRLLRERYLQGRQRLVVFFGFVYRSKGVEQLFRIADPARDALVVAGAATDQAYLSELERTAAEGGWGGNLHFTGFLPPNEAADLLAVADAVVLPFLAGAGDWNTSVHAATAQGTLVITTAEQPKGDDRARNIYTAHASDTGEMRCALQNLAGRKVNAGRSVQAWERIASGHHQFYKDVLRSHPESRHQTEYR